MKALKHLYESMEAESITQWIIEEKLGLNKTGLLLHGNEEISELKANELAFQLLRLQKGEPVQYVLGFAEFSGLRLKVNRSVLIPRPETEELVELIIKRYREEKNLNILDVGTGSGCIAIALKKNIPEAIVHASDISSQALLIAKENAMSNGVEVTFHQHDILNDNTVASVGILENKDLSSEFLSRNQNHSQLSFDLIVSNPPYVTQGEKPLMHQNVLQFEPHLALFVPDEDPLKFYKTIISFASKNLDPSGKIWLEINPQHVTLLCKMLIQNGFHDITLFKDINGKDRFIETGFSIGNNYALEVII
jgi:release factor glutamine methyltransferase